MNKPLLIVVTGSPASGKTTLANILSESIHCPVVSRDELKEGLLNTLNLNNSEIDTSTDLRVYELFFETIDLLISKDVSIIAEAAFQDKLWRPKLENLLHKAIIKVIVCKTNTDLIKTRFKKRYLNNKDREKYHGDESLSEEAFAALTTHYTPLNIAADTITVDTTEGYSPSIAEILHFIKSIS